MTTRKFLRFTYAAIKRYGDKTWTAHTGVVEFNPTYTVSCSECEKGNFGDLHDTAYIVELSNGTKFLCFINDYCGPDDDLLSERGETANSYAAKSHHDKNTAVLYRPGIQLMAEEISRCIGIGVKQGDRSLTVSLRDAANGDTELTTQKGGSRFITNYHDAVADWDGEAGTADLREILHPNIKLGEKEYIPSLGQLYFILAHFREINEALNAVGGDPLQDLWYWTSTEFSAPNAWNLYLNNGYANYYA